MKVKPIWILMKQEMVVWQWHQLDHTASRFYLALVRLPRQHLITQFLQAGCSS